MNDLTPFEYSGANVRTVKVGDDEVWFVAADVCAVLDLGNPRSSIALLDTDEKGVHTMDTPGGPQPMTMVSESGLYSLILRSRKPEAKAFKRWITSEVLPAIRKTGRYAVAVSRRELAEMVIAESDRADREAEGRVLAEAKVIELHPKADAWDTLADTGADYSAREAAYILNRDPEISTGQNRLLQLLRDWRVIDRHDKPYANHSRHVTLRPQTREAADGERVQAKPQVRVTVAGLEYLHKRLGGTSPLDFGAVAS